MIGLVFALATLWKVALSPDFLDTRFFRVTMLDDGRMEDFTRLAGGLGEAGFEDLRELVREHSDGVFVPWEAMPEQPARFRALATALTWSSVAMEASLAAAFLLPLAALHTLRHALLLLFCAGTYALAPVASFGWLLLSMGVSQTRPPERGLRLVYLVVFALVLLITRLPWLRALGA